MSKLTQFAIPYRHRNGREYTIEVFATDADDARQRIRSAYFQGEHPQKIVFQAEAPSWLRKFIGGEA